MKYPLKQSAISKRCDGMTLVEMMFALVISVVVLGIAVNFLVEATRSTLRVQSNTQNDLTDWGISAGITIDTRTANGMTLFKDFSASSFDSTTDEITTNDTRGDFLVLSRSSQEDGSKAATYLSLTGYLYTAGATAGTGTFQKFTYAVPDGEKSLTLETILSTHRSDFKFQAIAKGLDATHSDNAATPKNRAFLFRSYKLRSGVLNLEVSTGYKNVGTSNSKLIETAFFIRN
jgi:prepilin-type N-terminal cleavage/methylation domain-containing protein